MNNCAYGHHQEIYTISQVPGNCINLSEIPLSHIVRAIDAGMSPYMVITNHITVDSERYATPRHCLHTHVSIPTYLQTIVFNQTKFLVITLHSPTHIF